MHATQLVARPLYVTDHCTKQRYYRSRSRPSNGKTYSTRPCFARPSQSASWFERATAGRLRHGPRKVYLRRSVRGVRIGTTLRETGVSSGFSPIRSDPLLWWFSSSFVSPWTIGCPTGERDERHERARYRPLPVSIVEAYPLCIRFLRFSGARYLVGPGSALHQFYIKGLDIEVGGPRCWSESDSYARGTRVRRSTNVGAVGRRSLRWTSKTSDVRTVGRLTSFGSNSAEEFEVPY